MSITISEYVMRDDQNCFKKLSITVKKNAKTGIYWEELGKLATQNRSLPENK